MLENELKARVLRLDGAMGTQIQQYGLQPGEDLNLSRPDVIKAIHQAYIDAGADIIETNSFNVLGEHAAQNAREGARLARQVADAAPRKVWVAGSMGPSSKSLTLSPDISRPAWREYDFDQMAGAYAEARGFDADECLRLMLKYNREKSSIHTDIPFIIGYAGCCHCFFIK